MHKSHSAQIQAAPLYLLGSTVIILIFIFGYNALSDIGNKEKQLTSISMTSKLRNDIKSIASEFGTVKRVSYDVPNDVTLACFSDKNNFPLTCGNSECSSSSDSVPVAFIKDNPNNNLFFFSGSSIKSTEFIKEASIGCCQLLCFKNADNKITMTMEGKGDKAIVKRS